MSSIKTTQTNNTINIAHKTQIIKQEVRVCTECKMCSLQKIFMFHCIGSRGNNTNTFSLKMKIKAVHLLQVVLLSCVVVKLNLQ